MKHEPYGDAVVDAVLAQKPAERVRGSSGDPLDDEMCGILLGFAAVLQARGGHIDFITCRYAAAEMKEMLEREKEAAVDHFLKGREDAG